jgi:hypothetical protein
MFLMTPVSSLVKTGSDGFDFTGQFAVAGKKVEEEGHPISVR